MGLVTGLLQLPLAPAKGVVWLAEQIQEQAESEFYDPAVIRRKLQEVEDARAEGEISDGEAAELENELVGRLLEGRRRNDQEV